MAERSLGKRLLYDFLWLHCRIYGAAFYRFRFMGQHHVPRTGGALVLSNHQSHLDPLILGSASNRRTGALARKSLFRFAPFRWLIQSLDAIPIDRDGFSLGGMKEMIRRLRSGECMMIFPEGTRTRDGEVAAIKPGFAALAKRARVPLVPVAIDGAWQAWPRNRLFPRLGVLAVQFGQPITAAEVEAMTDDELVAEVERRIRTCHAAAREQRRRRIGRT